MIKHYQTAETFTVKPGTKILFANFPGDGHFNPLTGMAVHLKNLGCDVRWYTSTTYSGKIKAMDIRFYGFKKALDISAGSDIDAIFPERRKYKGMVNKLKFDLINVFILRSTEYYDDIKEIYKEFEFELMVADITFGGIPFVKEKMKIPVLAVSVFPNPETSKDLAPTGLGITPSYSVFGKIKQSILRFIADKILFARPTKVMRKMLDDYGIKTEDSNVFDILIQKSTVVLQSGAPGFEYERSDLSPHIFYAGPLLPHSKKSESKKWYSDKLKNYEHVILITQGTVEKDVSKLLVPSLDAFRNSNYLVIVTTGGSQTAELKELYPEENFIIEDFITFEDVMPYSDVYISNGGYGGVLLSIQNQLPMVVAGVHEGKNEINARIGYFDLGINLHTEKPTAQQIKESVELVLADPAFGKNVKRLSEEFKKYNPHAILEEHVAALTVKKISKRKEEVGEFELIY